MTQTTRTRITHQPHPQADRVLTAGALAFLE